MAVLAVLGELVRTVLVGPVDRAVRAGGYLVPAVALLMAELLGLSELGGLVALVDEHR